MYCKQVKMLRCYRAKLEDLKSDKFCALEETCLVKYLPIEFFNPSSSKESNEKEHKFLFFGILIRPTPSSVF